MKNMILKHATWRLSSGWSTGCYGAPGQCGCNLHLHLINMWDNRARQVYSAIVYSETFVVEKRGCWFWPPGGRSREKPPLMGIVNWVQKHVLGKCQRTLKICSSCKNVATTKKRSQNPNSLHDWLCGTGSSQGRGRWRSPTRWLESPSQGPPDICINMANSDWNDSSLISFLKFWKLCN